MSPRRGARSGPATRDVHSDSSRGSEEGTDGASAGQPHGPGTRASAIHAAWAAALIFLALLLVFIIQNLRSVSVHFFTARFRLPIGVVLVLAAVIGGAIVSVASLARVTQLRRRERRRRRGKPDTKS